MCFREMDEETDIASDTVSICTSLFLAVPVWHAVGCMYFLGFCCGDALKN